MHVCTVYVFVYVLTCVSMHNNYVCLQVCVHAWKCVCVCVCVRACV